MIKKERDERLASKLGSRRAGEGKYVLGKVGREERGRKKR